MLEIVFSCFITYLFCYGFFSAIASSAPIWQFTGMTPCNAFYRVTSSVYIDTSAECGLTILASWKAIDNVTKTGNAYFFYIIFFRHRVHR